MASIRKTKLRRTQLKMLRTILGQRRIYKPDGKLESWVEWVKRSTNDMRALQVKHGILDWSAIHAQRVSFWQARLTEMDCERWAKRLALWEPNGRRGRGHPVTRWSEQFAAEP